MSRRPSTRVDATIKLVDVLVKTLAAALLPGAAGTFVGESVGKGLELLSGRGGTRGSRLDRQLEDIALSITSEAINQREFFRMPRNDIEAAMLAVSDTIAAVPVDAALLRESNYSALRLYEYYRKNATELLRTAGLGEAGYAYVRILESVSHQIAAVLRASPEAHAMSIIDLSDRLSVVHRKLSNPGELYDEMRNTALDEYLLTYRLDAGKRLSRARSVTSGGQIRSLPMSIAHVAQRIVGDGRDDSLRDLVDTRYRILVEDHSGRGKSALLQQTFLQMLAYYDGSMSALVPIYIDFAGLQEFPDLDDSVARLNRWLPKGPSGWVETMIRAGRSIVFLDNIDDLFADPASRTANDEVFEAFMSEVAGDSKVVISARPGALSDHWIATNAFSVVRLSAERSNFALQQIEQWHGAVASTCETLEEQEQIQARGRELNLALCRISGLLGLGRSPLLCALMCEAFLDSSLTLPRDWIALVSDVLDRFAARQANAGLAFPQGLPPMREIQRGIAQWAIYNEPPFEASHFSDALRKLMAEWGVNDDPDVMVNWIVSGTALLRREPNGLTFTSEEMLDHLAAGDLVSFGNINYLRGEARKLAKPTLIVAAIGHARHERATELVMTLIDDAQVYPQVAGQLIVMAFCGATAARSIEPAARERVRKAAIALVTDSELEWIGDRRMAPLALDMLVQLVEDGAADLQVLAVMAVEIASRIGEQAFPALSAIAYLGGDDVQRVLWDSWSRFEISPYAEIVLRVCESVPKILLIDSPEKFSEIRELPRVEVIEVTCQVDCSKLQGRDGLIIHASSVDSILSIDSLGLNSFVSLGEGEL